MKPDNKFVSHLLSKVDEKKTGRITLGIYKCKYCGKETKTPRIMLLQQCRG